MKELAMQFGMHRSAIRRYLAARGIETHPSSLHPSDVPAAAQLYRSGWSFARIADKFGAAHNTVRVRLLEAGVVPRPQGGRKPDRVIHGDRQIG